MKQQGAFWKKNKSTLWKKQSGKKETKHEYRKKRITQSKNSSVGQLLN